MLQFEYDYHKNYNLKMKKNVYSTKGLCGILNIGNSCFINSILQCLSHTLILTDYILSAKYRDDMCSKRTPEFYTLHSYITLINNIWKENQLIRPQTFFENISKIHKKYFLLEQQDSHECLLYILDILHKSLSYQIEIEIKGEIKNKNDELMKKSLENWKGFYENDYSYIIEIFNGSLINNIKCINCNYTDQMFEPYNNLSISLPETSSTLYECLDAFFYNDNDNLINTWTCDECKHIGCNKSVDLWTLPNNIIINLKRFKNDNDFINKNGNIVKFPLNDLDLTKYVSKDKLDVNNYIYDCYAINYHSGSLNGGHYWSACKNLDGNWYNFNDGNVHKLDISNLVTNDSYILFYSRKFLSKKTLVI